MTSADELLAEMDAGLAADRAMVARLAVHRGWLAIVDESRKHQARLRDRVVNAIFRRRADPVDQRDVDYTRGVIAGIDWILSAPERMKGEGSAQ